MRGLAKRRHHEKRMVGQLPGDRGSLRHTRRRGASRHKRTGSHGDLRLRTIGRFKHGPVKIAHPKRRRSMSTVLKHGHSIGNHGRLSIRLTIDHIQPDAAIQLQRDPFTPSVALLKYAPYPNMRPDVDLDPVARVPMGSQHTRQDNDRVAIGISSLAQCRTGFQLPSFH